MSGNLSCRNPEAAEIAGRLNPEILGKAVAAVDHQQPSILYHLAILHRNPLTGKRRQDVETYQDFAYNDWSTDALREKVRNTMELTRARARAESAPAAGEYRIILTGSYVKELMRYYVSRAESSNITSTPHEFIIWVVLQFAKISAEFRNTSSCTSSANSASKKVRTANVSVYRVFEEDGERFRGVASVRVQDSQTPQELEKLFADAYYAAGFLKNKYYDLYAGAKEELVEVESTLAGKTLQIPPLSKLSENLQFRTFSARTKSGLS